VARRGRPLPTSCVGLWCTAGVGAGVTGQNVPPVKTSQSVSVKTSLCYWSKRARESKCPTNQNVPRP